MRKGTNRSEDLWPLMSTFFRIGLFTLGGGYAMIPLIEREVVERRRWLGREEMVDLIAVAQSCPGVFAINISTFVGYRRGGNRGAVCAAVGAALPSLLIILVIAMTFRQFASNPVVAAAFKGIRPAVVALIAAPAVRLAATAGVNRRTLWIPVASAAAIGLLGVSPLWIIAAAVALAVVDLIAKHSNKR